MTSNARPAGIFQSARGLLRHADRHPILAGISTNLIAEILRAATLPAIAVLAARYLGADRYGVLATGQVLVGMAVSLTGFGLMYGVLQLGSRHEEDLSTLLTSGLVASVSTVVLLYAGLFAWVNVFSYDSATREVTLVIGLSLFGTALAAQCASGLQVQGRYSMIAVGAIVSMVFNAAFAIAVIATNQGVVALAWSSVVGASTNAFILGYALRSELRAQVSVATARRLFGVGLPFGLNDFLYFIYFSADVVILSLISTERQVGLYNVPVRMIVVVYLLPVVVFNRVLYPRFFDWSVHDKQRLEDVYLLSSKAVLVIGLLVSSGLIIIADTAVPLVFTGSFEGSVPLLQVLAIAVPLRYFLSAGSTVLATSGMNRERFLLTGGSALLNIALCFAFIPSFEAMAAAVATVIGEAITLVVIVWLVQTRVLKAGLRNEAHRAPLFLPLAPLIAGVVAGHYWAWAPGVGGGCAMALLALLLGPLGHFSRAELTSGMTAREVQQPAAESH